jgi:hypothetical protein
MCEVWHGTGRPCKKMANFYVIHHAYTTFDENSLPHPLYTFAVHNRHLTSVGPLGQTSVYAKHVARLSNNSLISFMIVLALNLKLTVVACTHVPHFLGIRPCLIGAVLRR